MADHRVRAPKRYEALINSLHRMDSSDQERLFDTRADVLVFAASLGVCRDQWREFSQSFGDAIRLEVFENRHYLPVMSLLAVYKSGDTRILADTDDAERRRVEIFEGYANGGLAIIEHELRGSPDRLRSLIALILSPEQEEGEEGDFDLRDLGIDSS